MDGFLLSQARAELIHQGVDAGMEGTGVLSRLTTHRSLHIALPPRIIHASARVTNRITAMRGSPRGQAGALGGIWQLESPKHTSSAKPVPLLIATSVQTICLHCN